MRERCDRPDLNQRLPDLQSGTLPAELLSQQVSRRASSLQAFWRELITQYHQVCLPVSCEFASIQPRQGQQVNLVLYENMLIPLQWIAPL